MCNSHKLDVYVLIATAVNFPYVTFINRCEVLPKKKKNIYVLYACIISNAIQKWLFQPNQSFIKATSLTVQKNAILM